MDQLIQFCGIGIQTLFPDLLRFGYKISAALYRIDQSFLLQLHVGSLNGVGVDGQLSRQGADAGEFFSGGENAGEHKTAQTVFYLLVDGAAVPIIELYHDRKPPFGRSALIVLVHL